MMPMLDRARTGLAEPFRGIATNGEIVPGLFAINKTGVSLAALLEGARSFLFALTADKDKLGSISKEGDRYQRSLIKRTQVGITFSGMRCSATEIGIPDLL
jgi:hypothetical protein